MKIYSASDGRINNPSYVIGVGRIINPPVQNRIPLTIYDSAAAVLQVGREQQNLWES